MTEDSNILAVTRPRDTVAFDYIKAGDFRTVLVDGAIGGPTATGNIHLAVYTERMAIPRRQVHELSPETSELGRILPEYTVSRDAVVREMAADLVMTPETALSLAKWLVSVAEQARSQKVKRKKNSTQKRKGVR